MRLGAFKNIDAFAAFAKATSGRGVLDPSNRAGLVARAETLMAFEFRCFQPFKRFQFYLLIDAIVDDLVIRVYFYTSQRIQYDARLPCIHGG